MESRLHSTGKEESDQTERTACASPQQVETSFETTADLPGKDEVNAAPLTYEDRAVSRAQAEHYYKVYELVSNRYFLELLTTIALGSISSELRSDADDVVQMTVEKMLKYPDGIDLETGAYPIRLSVRQRITDVYRQRTDDQTGKGRKVYSASPALSMAEQGGADEDPATSSALMSNMAQTIAALAGGQDVSENVAIKVDIEAALASLPPEQRETVICRYYDGLFPSEIAEKLGLSLGTVKGRMRLGMYHLRCYFGLAERGTFKK
jgi:RNA polymerase sigma factor (sigma-70 family)